MKIIEGKIPKAQKIVIYGTEGIGKSTFAANFPDPLFIDTEGSTAALDVKRTEQPTSWSMLMQQVQYVKDNPDICKTLVIDTADWAEKLCRDFICKRADKTGIEDFGYGKGYTILEEEFAKLLHLLQDVIDVGINAVITAHAFSRTFSPPDQSDGYDRWEMKLTKKVAPIVKEWADMVLFANYEIFVFKKDKSSKAQATGGKRVLYTTHHPAYDAKNRIGLPEKIALDYDELRPHIEKYFEDGNRAEQITENTSTDPATEKVEQSTEEAIPWPTSEAQQEKQTSKLSQKDEVGQGLQSYSSAIPRELQDLMRLGNVTEQEFMDVCVARGYKTQDTPIENYGDEFLQNMISVWDQVLEAIKSMRFERENKITGSIPFDL